ncbi:hypothetical protein AB6D66_00350 [Vibrio pomeroyi]|uniref:Uncharacterized protein n=1 Tax=Vibrio pomeroyi TaxID=198832 RepID=A0ABV4MQR9_9VIBR|nr:hypothetical protein [Vibrio atlanticus]MCZ4310999.1 hypothetical protein [Vibrio atlanticus]
MIVTKTLGKWETEHFALNALEDSLFDVLDTAEHEGSDYTLTKSVVVNIPEDQLPKSFLRSYRYTHNKVEGTDVSYGVNIDTRRGLDIDINFAYSLHLSRKRSDEGRQLIRDNVTAEFSKVDFLQAAKDALAKIMTRNIEELNRQEEDKMGRFFESNAAKSADKLLEDSKHPEWQFLAQQEEMVKKLLEDINVRQSVLRKEALIEELEQDEREFPENIKSIVDDNLTNVDGISHRRMFFR